MRACKNCRFAHYHEPDLYICCWKPPRLEEIPEQGKQWLRPPMRAQGWCGQFKLAFWRWLKNCVVRGT